MQASLTQAAEQQASLQAQLEGAAAELRQAAGRDERQQALIAEASSSLAAAEQRLADAADAARQQGEQHASLQQDLQGAR